MGLERVHRSLSSPFFAFMKLADLLGKKKKKKKKNPKENELIAASPWNSASFCRSL